MLYNMVENRPLTVVSELKVLINLTKVLERSWKSPYFWSAQMCGNPDYRSRQFHRTSNDTNPSSGFKDMAKVLPDLTSFWPMGDPIWGKWANNYDVAQVQVLTSPWNFKWGKSIQRFQRYTIRKVWTQFVANLTSFWPMSKPIWGKWPWQCTTTGLHNSTELRTENIRQAVTEI